MPPRYVVDTNLYIEAITSDAGNDALASFQRHCAPFLYQHSVVAQEILAGAGNETDYRGYYDAWIAPFEALGRIITPDHETWMRAARVLTRLVQRGAVSRGGFSRSFLNDCLIAASVRQYGLTIVTKNTADFERIASVEHGVRFVAAWPGLHQ